MNKVYNLYLIKVLGWNNFHKTLIKISLSTILYLFCT